MKYAIVTGATRGIGKAIAEKLLSEGMTVAVCARDEQVVAALKEEWNEKFPSAVVIAMPADMSRKIEVTNFANHILAQFPKVDILVNNAGAYIPGNIADEPEGRLEMMIGVNLYSAYHLTRKILPVMKKNEAGHIFNICSIASLHAYPGGGSYSISKYALLGFSDNLRAELMGNGIKVTAVCPGATYTSSWEGSGVDAERIMEATDVADVIWNAYNLSPQANIDTIVMRPLKGDL